MTKKELLQYVDEHKEELIRLVSELIQIKSENPTGTQRDVINYVEAFLKEAGIKYQETGCNPDYPCIVAEIGSEAGFSMALDFEADLPRRCRAKRMAANRIINSPYPAGCSKYSSFSAE